MKREGKALVWDQYQKDIPEDRYYYVRSCIRQNFFPGSETAFLHLVRNDLGRDVFDDPAHTTCTGIAYHADIIPFETIMTVIARQFALMTAAGYENLVVSCVTSFGLYNEVVETWKHFPDTERKIRAYLRQATGREFTVPKSISHASDIVYRFREEIADRADLRLVNRSTGKPLRVVEHTGCHYAKMFPSAGVGGAEFPYVLQGMVEAWGGEVIDYPERRHCCGFGFRHYLIRANRGYSVANTKIKLESMKPYQPDLIVCNCPGCTMFLDRWQYTISEMENVTYDQEGYGIPVLTYEELAGLVLGYDPWRLGLQLHQVQADRLLDKMGVQYDPGEKYRGPQGEDLGMPERPRFLKV